MGDIWSFLLQTLTASLTAAVLLCAKGLFREQLSPRWQYGVWGVLALRILLPAGLLGRSLLPLGRVLLEAVKTAVEGNLGSVLCGPYGVTRVYAPVPLLFKGLPAPGSVTDVLFYIYAAGVAASLLWFLGTYLRLRQTLRRGHAPEPDRLEQLKWVCSRYSLPDPARVVVCPQIESAFVCGPLRPVLVLPEEAVDDKVLLHELIHLKYGDVWAGVGMCLLRCFHWCNPFLWYCWDRAQNDCEALCDQRVLERLEGEDRRAYGKILLSMAGDKYARAPGTSSMANGGANIKRRIVSIARFKRYPAGVALGAGCIAVILAVGCLTGSAQAWNLEDMSTILPLALAQSRLCRPTTPAGALDTYVKAVLGGNGIYLSMVTPQEGQAELAKRLAEQEGVQDWQLKSLSADLEEAGFAYTSQVYTNGREERYYHSYQAEWRVLDFFQQPDGSYTGLLVLDGHYWITEDWQRVSTVLYQPVRVSPQDGSWTVTPLSDWEKLPPGERVTADSSLPRIRYVGETEDLRVEISYLYQLGVYNQRETNPMDGLFAWAQGEQVMDPIPQPHTPFNDWDFSGGKRVTRLDTGETVGVSTAICILYGDEPERWSPETADRFEYQSFTGKGGGGGTSPSGSADHQTAPSGIAVKVIYGGQIWYTLALPEGGAA